MKTLLMFAGQGAQYEKMGLDLLESFPHLTKRLDIASKVLNEDVTSWFYDNNSYERTERLQIMMVITQAMMYDIVSTHYEVDGYLGFSLGEMSALYASNYYTYESLLKLTHARATAMGKASQQSKGVMAAVLNLEPSIIESLCQSSSNDEHMMMPVNYNAPNQTVISGHEILLPKITERLKEAGARVIPLNVSGAFHTPLMKTYRVLYEQQINETSFNMLSKPVLSNVTGTWFEPSQLPNALLEQMISPVLFTTMIETAILEGFDTLIEIGPGKVLSNLVMKQYPEVNVITYHNATSLEALK
jgi:[acyl-carrier-protein] S-malonyltransferase